MKKTFLYPCCKLFVLVLGNKKKHSRYLEFISRSIKALIGASKLTIGGEVIGYELDGSNLVEDNTDNENNRVEDLYQITELLKSAVPEGKRLVIFIDDLDRCLPDKALNLFNSIKSFLDIKGYVFCNWFRSRGCN